MNNQLLKFKTPLILSLLLVLPFMLMEWINVRDFTLGFPFGLFGYMWLVALIFSFAGSAWLRSLRKGEKNPGAILMRLLLLVVIGISIWSFSYVLADQWPCFLGVPNCD
ncbi:MAG TPA: hypothetical protein VN364_12715 [Bellilinea sp.]|nr:hypothetical protein [Bellilinea sp.]